MIRATLTAADTYGKRRDVKMIEIIQKPGDCHSLYPERFKSGDTAICLHTVIFVDRDRHLKGNEYVVEEKTKAYYNVCYAQYDLKTTAPETTLNPKP